MEEANRGEGRTLVRRERSTVVEEEDENKNVF